MLISTIYGEIDAGELRRQVQIQEDEFTRSESIEYYLGPVLVHRSTHVILKGLPS
jgi:hypothetical protein